MTLLHLQILIINSFIHLNIQIYKYFINLVIYLISIGKFSNININLVNSVNSIGKVIS